MKKRLISLLLTLLTILSLLPTVAMAAESTGVGITPVGLPVHRALRSHPDPLLLPGAPGSPSPIRSLLPCAGSIITQTRCFFQFSERIFRNLRKMEPFFSCRIS